MNYSNIAAKVVRKALKPELQADAAKRDIVSVKFMKWENGKPVGKCINSCIFVYFQNICLTSIFKIIRQERVKSIRRGKNLH